MDRATTELPLLQNFPTEGAHRLRGSAPAQRLHSTIGAAALAEFERVCAAHEADLFTGLHAALALLLARCSGEREVRLAAGDAVLTSDLAIGRTFGDLLAQSRAIGARADEPAGLRLDLAARDHAAASDVRADLAFSAVRVADALTLHWDYSVDLVGAAGAERLARRFAVLIGAVARAPATDVWRLPLLDEAERHQVLRAWNDTRAPFKNGTLHELFAEQAHATPQSVALVWRDVALEYSELNRRANRLAHFLRAQGVGAQSLVAVCLERSPRLLVGLLAILKAGGAYVPLDPNYPRDRIEFMLADSGARWVLTQASTVARIGAAAESIVLDDAELERTLDAYPSDDPEPLPGHAADALAYIIYTSGSTGRPKGVCIEHRHAAALIGWAQDTFDADAMSGTLAATSICFDLSIFELFVPLCSGGRVLLVDGPLDFAGVANAPGLRLINTVPSAIKALLDEKAIPPSVRIVNLAGEPLPESLVRDIYRQTAAEAVYNLYGPSEDTTYSTGAMIARERAGAPPIGRPIANGQAYVLDAHLEPVGIGMVGEVYVGGAGVARGYWNRPELTAERFLADPFALTPGARFYKTGDLARWSADGELEFLGRVDFQVKLRGLRIELGEIQAALLDLDTIDDAIVTVCDDARGEKLLIAYVVPHGTPDDFERDCRARLAERLPAYMIPALLIPLARLPLTPNGKVDRAALPKPPQIAAPEFVAPHDGIEARLAQMWQEVLRVPAVVSRNAQFFELGGNSILAMRLLARVRTEFGVDLPLKALFSGASLEQFAAAVASGGERAMPPPIRAVHVDTVPLSSMQQTLWVIDQLEGGSAVYNVQQRYLLEGELDPQALQRALAALAQRHDSLRMVVVPDPAAPRQRMRDAVDVPFAQIDLSALPEAERSAELERIVADDARAPFVLDRDAMLRATLVRCDAVRWELLLSMHHIATDGWSLDVLASELGTLYADMRQGRAASLAPLPLRYADYAAWERDWLSGERLEGEAQYWLQQLEDLPLVHALPLDRPRPEQLEFAAGLLRTYIGADVVHALKDLARSEYATLFMAVHAAFCVLIARYSGEQDIALGSPVANRATAELDGVIGLFTNTLVLRAQVPGDASFVDLLRQSRRITLDGHAHQHVPLHYLADRLHPERSLSHHPLFQIMLSLQDTGRTPLELPGLIATQRPSRPPLAMTELMLEFTDTADGLELCWIYRSALFDAATIERMARDFEQLLRGSLAQPRRDIWSLPLAAAGSTNVPSAPRAGTRAARRAAAYEENLPRAPAPHTPSEHELHALWARLLQRQALDIDLNFFAAGGNSLLLMRLLHGIRERFGVTIELKQFFAQPSIRALAAAIDAAIDAASVPQPAAAPSTAAAPQHAALSLSQFRIWYLEQIRGGDAHNIPFTVALRGALDAALLERALNQVIARHAALRSAFVLAGDAPVQVVQDAATLALEYRDISALAAAEQAASAEMLAVGHATRGFDIARPPLLAAMLLRLARDEYRLHLNFHHLVFDGWSFAIFFEEMLACYEALLRGAEPAKPILPHTYADYVAWQQQWLASDAAAAQAQFWRDYLRGCPEHLGLTRQSAWPGEAPGASTRLVASVDPATRRGLATLARTQRGSPFAVLYGAFALLLGRLSGQPELVVGIPVSGRHLRVSQGVIGNFLNNLPVRTRWESEQPFDAYLAEQVQNIERVLSNQDYPFEKMLEDMPNLRGSEASPLFQTFFNMLSLPQPAASRLFEVAFESATEIEPKFDLTLYVVDDGDEITLTCHGRRAAFSSGAIAHLLRQYVLLLQQIAADPGRPCGAYSLCPDIPEEQGARRQPQRFWLGAVHEQFRARATAAPQAPAVVEHGQQWSYGELLAASSRLAQELQQQGVGAGDVVALIAARRACLVLGVLAVLQTGAAFSVLDPEYPLERVALLVDILKPAAVLFAGERAAFQPALGARLEEMAPCRYLASDKSAWQSGAPGDFVPATVEPEQLACVTFTSGTTGTPKAVAGTHIGIAGYLGWVPQWLELSACDRFSMLSGLGHDPLQRDLFSSLCIGATLVIPEPEAIAPHALAEWLRRQAITFVHVTPAMAEIVCTTEASRFPSLRVAFITGDKLSGTTVAKLLAHNPAMRVLNSYGTTETQRATTYFEMRAGRVPPGLVPVSEGSPDTVIRVLNAVGTACGFGEVGDVFVESHALSRGYRNDAELTAKVMTDLGAGLRRYRTGDIGCRQPDGTITLLGRKDNQVKIRGFRIETGEIEAHACRHPAVKEACVAPRARARDETALVAYIVPKAAPPDEAALRASVLEHLNACLPPYMVPAAVVVLERLPLTPNGKLDRRALPEPNWEAAVGTIAPRTDLESTVASIWAEVLGLERVGVEDNFFALGGHSMLMVLLLNRMRERLGLRGAGVGRILSCATVAEQAKVLSALVD